MKKITAVLILAVVWYFAGMFRQPAVMALTICGILLVLVLIIMSIYQKHHMSIELPKAQIIGFKNIQKPIKLYAENKSLLPVNRFKVVLRTGYANDKKTVKRKFNGSALGRNANNDNVSEFYITAPYCGIINIDLKKIKVYDNLAMFSSSKRVNSQAKLLIYPIPKEMNIIIPFFGSYDNSPVTESISDKTGDDHSEIKLIREYRPGDLYRHIHHNHSAKTGNIWVKEYKKENDLIFDLLIDTSSDSPLTPEVYDALYEIVYSVTTSLVKKEILLKVHWFDNRLGGLTEMLVENEEQANEMLAALYNTDKSCNRLRFSGAASQLPPEAMIINSSLEWYFGGKPVYRFSLNNFEKELYSIIFTLNN